MTVCCVLGCPNDTRNRINKGVKFYHFPSNNGHMPWLRDKRLKWINAVQKHVKHPNWGPYRTTAICSAHFVGNKKSENPVHPSYVPTIFPGKKNNPELLRRKFEMHQSQMQGRKFVVKNILRKVNINTTKQSVACQTDITGDQPYVACSCSMVRLDGDTVETQGGMVSKSLASKLNALTVTKLVSDSFHPYTEVPMEEITMKAEPLQDCPKEVQLKIEPDCNEESATNESAVKLEIELELEMSPENDSAIKMELCHQTQTIKQEPGTECPNSEQLEQKDCIGSENIAVPQNPETSTPTQMQSILEARLTRETATVSDKEKEHVCSVCKKAFAAKFNLACHMTVHNNEKLFACNLCLIRFKTSIEYLEHKKIHAKNICTVCEKEFPFKAILNAHMRTHKLETNDCSDSDLKTKPHECMFCSERFETRFSLYQHVETHSRNHICDVCNKGFSTRKFLSEHMITHSDKSFRCELCPRQFLTLFGKNQHIRRVHLKQRY